jgi:hypothetical protein
MVNKYKSISFLAGLATFSAVLSINNCFKVQMKPNNFFFSFYYK